MSKLSKRKLLFPDKAESSQMFRSFHAPQRERVVLAADEKPQHGVSQPMPSRKVSP